VGGQVRLRRCKREALNGHMRTGSERRDSRECRGIGEERRILVMSIRDQAPSGDARRNLVVSQTRGHGTSLRS
jgi:hypothetical protein